MQSNLRLIVFFIPPEKIINGGILSIFSICKTSRQFKNVHKSEVVLAAYPGAKSYGKNNLFENDEIIYSFEEVVARGLPQSLQLHVPEYASHDVLNRLGKHTKYLQAIPNLSVNIMNQNILLMQPPENVANWFKLTPTVTQTTAHNKYATQELADKYYLPTHHLSTFVDPSQYKHIPYEQKEKLIVLSPDKTEKREAIVAKIRTHYLDYKFITIQNMRYEKYKDVVSRAKFTITFGEGFDGYYVESFFSNGVALAVYNDDFFPGKDFSKSGNTFSSYDDMLTRITDTMERLNNKLAYEKVVKANMGKLSKLYDFNKYCKNLEDFYRGKFTFVPQAGSAQHVIAAILRERDDIIKARQKLLVEKETAIQDQSKMIADLHTFILGQDVRMQEILNSSSWKITKPLRKAKSVLKVKKRPN